MRLTVGPLPPAIYWRRRAVVLGALLLLLFVVVYSCVGSGQSGGDGRASPDPSASGNGPTLTPQTGGPSPTVEGETTTGDDGTSGGEPADGGVGDPGAPDGGDGTGTATGGGQPPAGGVAPPPAEGAPAGGTGSCTDDEIVLTPAASQTTAQLGVTLTFRLRVQNGSSRTCDRDVGADPQELYLKRGAELIWSSDTCGAARGTDVQTFGPGTVREYQVAWNGRAASECANDVAAGEFPAAGQYQLFARLGAKVSEPVVITLTS
ncbi:hypothetical protein O7632_30695 [Solwaraspora sp. WMMD406]|uniref:hypothetical protein n=1 Tax=Solwaraspora sp. WMMD406 TaxID=3016095 RepID=UPI002417179A|nr:hypothetical protein [Solwaraspora sp. WMMD406]MDG4768430.1 hypothetical protein [Solwaraspora sp. WMMD406]